MIATGGSKRVRYNRVAVILHWVTAILMIYMLFWGEDLMRGEGGQPGSNPGLHATLGVSILVLTLLRLVWRFYKPPPPDVPMPSWQAAGAHALHWLFYALLIIIPLSGMAAMGNSIAGRHPDYAALQIFGFLPIPHYSLPWFGHAHGLMTKVAIGLLIVHVLAALKHQFIDRDGLIARMS